MRYDIFAAAMAPARKIFFPEDMDDAARHTSHRGKTGQGAPPNIVLVCLDQTSYANSAAFGGACPMPVLEQLAASGRRRPRIGGRSAGDHRLTDILKSRGYSTARFGACPDGANLRVGRNFDHIDAKVCESLQFGERAEPSACHFTECMTSRAIDWLDRLAQPQPFFLSWSPCLPSSAQAVPRNWTMKHRPRFETFDMAALGGFLDYVDYHFSRLFNYLDSRGMTDDTLILVAGLDEAPSPAAFFTDILTEDRISPEAAANMVRAQIRLRGGADAYLEKAAEWGRKAANAPHWAHGIPRHKPGAGHAVILHWPSGTDQGLDGGDITQLIVTATACAAGPPKTPPAGPPLCVSHALAVVSG